MRFTERELTAALEGAAKSVLAAQDKEVRKGRRTADDAWAALTKFQRYQMLSGLGDQLLGPLVALPDVEVAVGTRPAFTDAQVQQAVQEQAGEELRGMKGKVLLKARVALVQLALSHVPPRADPDALVVPDHL
ncbi:hypothetical protein [Nocardioides sp.]|uniref:hypothetical protein n=1 Tax=Nocardioides sp. TaxID=35761 RepID=UPI001A28FC20|nr:hypothetical protein [Nocardioides sp.]MBJ7359285.1 hypothetical protein [Nocardioides sp.]